MPILPIDFIFPNIEDVTEKMGWEGKEVIHEIKGQIQLVERITLSGMVLKPRTLAPFVRIGEVMARLVEIDEDGLHVKAYFDQDLPGNQVIEFGYHGEGVMYRFPIRYHPGCVIRLDRKMLPKSMLFLEHGVFDWERRINVI
jgi:hypothetical protein